MANELAAVNNEDKKLIMTKELLLLTHGFNRGLGAANK